MANVAGTPRRPPLLALLASNSWFRLSLSPIGPRDRSGRYAPGAGWPLPSTRSAASAVEGLPSSPCGHSCCAPRRRGPSSAATRPRASSPSFRGARSCIFGACNAHARGRSPARRSCGLFSLRESSDLPLGKRRRVRGGRAREGEKGRASRRPRRSARQRTRESPSRSVRARACSCSEPPGATSKQAQSVFGKGESLAGRHALESKVLQSLNARCYRPVGAQRRRPASKGERLFKTKTISRVWDVRPGIGTVLLRGLLPSPAAVLFATLKGGASTKWLAPGKGRY